jgi:LacI family transcriptional regulator
MKKGNFRIKDIALKAGVSVGTVDRVIHNRGRVSEDAMKKVMEVMEQIDYRPNLLARTLGSNKTIRIAALVPDPTLDAYWAQSMSGVYKAEKEWAKYGVVVEHFLFDQHDKAAFEKKAHEVLKSKPDGVLLAPLFYKEALPILKQLNDMGVDCVTFNTRIPKSGQLCFIGQDHYRSGRVAGELMALGSLDSGVLAILHIHEDIPNSLHLVEKEDGFRSYFDELKNGEYEIKTLSLSDPEEPSFQKQLLSLINDFKLKGLFISTSKAYAVASILQKHGIRGICIVGYDLVEENIHYIKAGFIQFIINQNPNHQAFLGINHLANALLFKNLLPKTEYLPLEIITRENFQSYLNSRIHF